MNYEFRERRAPIKMTREALEIYVHDLQLYTIPPRGEILLSEYEELALERLQLFRILEQASRKGNETYSSAWTECILAELKKYEQKWFYMLADGYLYPDAPTYHLQARRADHISHFVLRLAYCRTESLRRWFVTRELEWFHLRSKLSIWYRVNDFLEINNLQEEALSIPDTVAIEEELSDSTAGTSIRGVLFYKIRFAKVPSLIAKREVLVKGGYAYVPDFRMTTYFMDILRSSLSEALVYASKQLPQVDDLGVLRVTSKLEATHVDNVYTRPDSNSVSLANLDGHARKHFPLCMRHNYDILKRDHHLKHFARLQFGLFLKGIGLTYEDAMAFWRKEFTQKMTDKTFDKNYAYNVMHVYEMVGQSSEYNTPYSCSRIIEGHVGPTESHGCPFKHWDSPALKSKLFQLGMRIQHTKEIIDMTLKGQCQQACAKYFNFHHEQDIEDIIIHPNQYYEKSTSSNFTE